MTIEHLRISLYVVLLGIAFMLFQTWEKEHPATLNNPTPAVVTASNSYVPTIPDTTATASTATGEPAKPMPAPAGLPSQKSHNKIVHVTTDVLDVGIDTLGGNLVDVKFPKYPQSLHSDVPFQLLNNTEADKYLAQSGLISANGPDTSKGQAAYKVDKTEYTLANGEKELQVKLTWENSQGVAVNKIFTFNRNSYDIDVAYEIDNQSDAAWNGNLFMQLMRKNNPPPNNQGAINLATYFGAAISSPDKPYEKIPFKNMNSQNLNREIKSGWAAMIQHYFVSAWVPNKDMTFNYFTRVTNDGLYTVGLVSPTISVAPKSTLTTQAKLYTGPSIASELEKVAPGLNLTIDYGWFWFISGAIFWVMQQIYNVIGNWGWSIVLVTLIIKLLFYHLSAKSYHSMGALKKLQPKIAALKERLGDDKQKFTQATMELYKKEKVNPMSGCLPILVQIPVFIGLYWVLVESVQLRQAPFILWIHDLSTKDPYYILPVLMGISMFLQQRLSPPPPDPMQAKIMMFMPVVFTALFFNFPAGLMLYWFVNNTLSFIQQWYIIRSMEAKTATVTPKKA